MSLAALCAVEWWHETDLAVLVGAVDGGHDEV